MKQTLKSLNIVSNQRSQQLSQPSNTISSLQNSISSDLKVGSFCDQNINKETKDLIKQILLKNANNPTTKAILDKIVATSNSAPHKSNVDSKKFLTKITANRLNNKNVTIGDSMEERIEILTEKNRQYAQQQLNNQSYHQQQLSNNNNPKQSLQNQVTASFNNEQISMNHYHAQSENMTPIQSKSALQQFNNSTPQVIRINSNFSQAQKAQNRLSINNEKQTLQQQSYSFSQLPLKSQKQIIVSAPRQHLSREQIIFKDQMQQLDSICGGNSDTQLPSLISKKKEVINKNNSTKKLLKSHQNQGSLSALQAKNYSSSFKQKLYEQPSPHQQVQQQNVSVTKSRIKIKQGQQDDSCSINDVSLSSNQHKMSVNEEVQGNISAFNPKKENIVTVLGYQKVYGRPSTDTKKKRLSNQKHLVIRDQNFKKDLSNATKQSLQNKKQSDQQNKQQQSIYMFTFSNSDNPNASLAERALQLQNEIAQRKNQENKIDDTTQAYLLSAAGSLIKPQHSSKPSQDQDTFALSQSHFYEQNNITNINNISNNNYENIDIQNCSPNFQSLKKKQPNEVQDKGPTDFCTIKDYFDQEMNIPVYKKNNKKSIFASSFAYNNSNNVNNSLSVQGFQQPQILESSSNNNLAEQSFNGHTPEIVKRPFSMCQKVRSNSSQMPKKLRPISCLVKNSNLPQVFLEDYSNFSSEKIPRLQSSYSHQRPPLIHKHLSSECGGISTADNVQSRNNAQTMQTKANSDFQAQDYTLSQLPKSMMQSFEQNNHAVPPIPRPPQRRIQSSNQQYRKPVINKKFFEKMLNNKLNANQDYSQNTMNEVSQSCHQEEERYPDYQKELNQFQL